MRKFKEDLLQLVWQNKLLKPLPLITQSGQEILILKAGDFNPDAGPDFFNARIKLNGIELVGNIEIHVKTSDWLKHGHQRNTAYNNLILHVVYEHDVSLPQNTDNHVEVLELKYLIDENTFENYDQLVTAKGKLPCASQLICVNDFKFTSWMQRMTVERLEGKVKYLERAFVENKGDYAQTFYQALLKSFGFKVNALPFELIAVHLPFKILLRHADNCMQLEALFLGVSGLLENQFNDKYLQRLQNEFEFLKAKYNLIPLKSEIFKFSKLRPANFPTLRLAQLATLINQEKTFITRPQDFCDYHTLMEVLKITPQGYWKNHYGMGGRLQQKDMALGNTSAENIIINTFAPFYFFYSKKTGMSHFSEIAINLLATCSFESNSKTKLFETKKPLLKNSADSQAIIHLHDHYCSKKRCLKCAIAAAILK